MTPERFRTLRAVLDRRQPDLTVLMDRVHKPHNFSAALRTCDAVGVLDAHLVPTDDFRPAHQTAGGSNRYVNVQRHGSLGDALRTLRDDGMTVLAAHPAGDAVDFRAVDYTGPTAILLGTELHGLSDDAAAAADRRVVIPMMGAAESLNVSVAAAVILYEAQRQRSEAGLYDGPRLDEERYRRTLFEWAYPRIADLCRRRGVEYPPLGEDGEILGELPR
ncbi:MAG: tRNA (guanosine(18)-2'-O)-methyltransferase TrmH [Longimicrobiales bacterium]